MEIDSIPFDIQNQSSPINDNLFKPNQTNPETISVNKNQETNNNVEKSTTSYLFQELLKFLSAEVLNTLDFSSLCLKSNQSNMAATGTYVDLQNIGTLSEEEKNDLIIQLSNKIKQSEEEKILITEKYKEQISDLITHLEGIRRYVESRDVARIQLENKLTVLNNHKQNQFTSSRENIKINSTEQFNDSYYPNTNFTESDSPISQSINIPQIIPTTQPESNNNKSEENGAVVGEQVNSKPKAKRPPLPAPATEILKNWLFEHKEYPYPTEEEKVELGRQTNLSLSQICNWFTNARRRILSTI